ncbi:iron-containing alcohol dehydrogenase [Roseospira marina]|uniref:Iron-containing alcohol dehydrogenase n=2 Tax=Roseospira marina TaxID=140057 RepID=A0A5M6I8G4_9PROT|nr:iron-containing alcohol dehydrogenase [Roseospira marina]
MRLDRPLEMFRPTTTRFGTGQLTTLSEWLEARRVRTVLVVSDPFNATRIDRLGIGAPAVFSDMAAEPDLNDLQAALTAARACDADLVIGFGGGSAMDLAKIVAVLLRSEKGMADIVGPNRAPAREVGLVQIPTTAGTGSEVGTRALITDPLSLNKMAAESPHMIADLVIIDPELTRSVPPAVTAATGIDALAHCVESYTSKRAHPLIDGYALQGIELVGRYLPQAVRNGDDLEARAGLSLAAFYGGVCLGPVNTTAGHAVSYPLGTRHKIPHGLANALIFPHTLAANASTVPEKTARICQALGGEADPTSETAVRDVAAAFCRGLDLDMTLSGHGVPANDLETMAREAHGIRRLLDFNPRDLSERDILALYEAAY